MGGGRTYSHDLMKSSVRDVDRSPRVHGDSVRHVEHARAPRGLELGRVGVQDEDGVVGNGRAVGKLVTAVKCPARNDKQVKDGTNFLFRKTMSMLRVFFFSLAYFGPHSWQPLWNMTGSSLGLMATPDT